MEPRGAVVIRESRVDRSGGGGFLVTQRDGMGWDALGWEGKDPMWCLLVLPHCRAASGTLLVCLRACMHQRVLAPRREALLRSVSGLRCPAMMSRTATAPNRGDGVPLTSARSRKEQVHLLC